MKPNTPSWAIAVAAVVIAILLLWRQFSSPTMNLRPSAAVGAVLAEEVGRLLGGRGTVVVISRQAPTDGPNADRERIDAFASALKRRATLRLAATEWLPRPPLGTMDLGVVAPHQFVAALEKHPGANAFLVLAGLPPFSQPLAEKLTVRSVKLLAVCGYSADVRRWLESKALAVAIVPRFDDPPAGTPAPKTAKDWLDREYQLVTPETIGLLPY